MPELAGLEMDDDGQVIDSLVEPISAPPPPEHQPTEPLSVTPKPRAHTRLLTGTATLLASWGAIPLLPADPSRVSLAVYAYAVDGSAQPVRLADDPGKIQADGGAITFYTVTPTLALPARLSGHTGPVWIGAPDATQDILVTFVAVTL